MTTALWVVGAPGAGKTTMIRTLLELPEAIARMEAYLVEKPKWTVGRNWCAAGHYTGATFDGADMVPYNGAAAALDFWESRLRLDRPLTVFDGDRFSNAGVLERVGKRVDQVRVVLVRTSPADLERRRAARGSNQNAAWARGRATKAERFAELVTADGAGLVVDGTLTPAQQATNVRAWLQW